MGWCSRDEMMPKKSSKAVLSTQVKLPYAVPKEAEAQSLKSCTYFDYKGQCSF